MSDAEARTLSVVHETVYRYAEPVQHSRHLLRLRPVHDHQQQVVEFDLAISAFGERWGFQDLFGNEVAYHQVSQPYTELRIVSHSVVRVSRPRPLEPPLAVGRPVLPPVWSQPEQRMMLPYLDHPDLPDDQIRDLYDYALSFAARCEYDILATLLDMNATINHEFSYSPSTTSMQTTPWEVLHGRGGVCQDFANLLIAMARLLGIPARYRVGYIFTGGDYVNKLQSEASHAWVECYLPWLGWRGFDPTNGVTTGMDHVRVACGRSYHSATPTSGSYRGGGSETLEVMVRVEEIVAGAPAV
jgi:transglutaminase-like putative cysteine protease